ncbi:MAG: rRNA methyltransferase [Gammaproteobacteria bacterium]|nr:rRNA methyltransferase [Gammaproteobacteria bacterium]|tara:strand:- start:2881 stop:3345 length:465 start_codon:yes stop_codon:yes gene_type:complete
MVIKIISIGNKLNKWESEAINFYIKQLPKNIEVVFINLKSQQNPKYGNNEVIEKEFQLINAKISNKDFIIAWDKKGEQISSKEFSNLILKHKEINHDIAFIIGGSFGLSSNILDRANKILSASLFTFPHKLFRLIIVEQIYRAHTILNNMPYHK